MRLTTVWNRFERFAAPSSALDRHRAEGLCIATTEPSGRFCTEPALDGSWCEQHAVLFDDDGSLEPLDDRNHDDSELSDGMFRFGDARDDRYEFRGRRWNGGE